MTQRKTVVWLSILWLGAAGLLRPSLVTAQSTPAPEKQKIEAMIRQVADLKDAEFAMVRHTGQQLQCYFYAANGAPTTARSKAPGTSLIRSPVPRALQESPTSFVSAMG